MALYAGRAYELADKVIFEDKHQRSDIAADFS